MFHRSGRSLCSRRQLLVPGLVRGLHASYSPSISVSRSLGPSSSASLAGSLISRTRPLLGVNRRSRYQDRGSITPTDAKNPLSKPESIDKGALNLVSVPIGNLKDFSLRALEVLKHVDYIVCVDRETTKVLMDLIDINCSGRLIHYREDHGNAQLVNMLKEGRSMALVAPSGTPCVGDKGSDLVKQMLNEGIRVTSVPGPSSIIAALSISGLTVPSGCFFFGNFLPTRQALRLQTIRSISSFTHPSIFFELPRSLLGALQDFAVILPKRRLALLHEVTKLNESLHCDTAEKLLAFYTRGDAAVMLRKGQVVIVVEGELPKERTDHVGLNGTSEIHKMVKDHAGGDTGVEMALRVVSNLCQLPLASVQQAYDTVEQELERQRKREEAKKMLEKTSSASGESSSSTRGEAESLGDVSAGGPTVVDEQKKLRRMARRRALVERIERKQEAIRLKLLAQIEKAKQ